MSTRKRSKRPNKNCWAGILSSLAFVGLTSFATLAGWATWYTFVTVPILSSAVLGMGVLALNGSELFLDEQEDSSRIEELRAVIRELVQLVMELTEELIGQLMAERYRVLEGC